jgi:hypothetical protein
MAMYSALNEIHQKLDAPLCSLANPASYTEILKAYWQIGVPFSSQRDLNSQKIPQM